MALPPSWKIAGDAALQSRSWDGEHVVYHPRAGDTHLLGEAAFQVLARLQSGPADWPTLQNLVSAHCHVQETAELPVLTGTILADLVSLRLIEPS